VAGE
jgi:hypothetical protein